MPTAGPTIHKFPCVRNFTIANRPDPSGGNGCQRSGLSSERDKLHLVSLRPPINVNNGSNVPRLKSLFMERRRQHHSVVFANHIGKILERMGGDQPRNLASFVDNPDRSDRGCAAVWAGDRAVYPVLCPISRTIA